MSATYNILAVNGGSSSLKFALFVFGEHLDTLWRGEVEGLGKGKVRGHIQFGLSTAQQSIDAEVRDISDVESFVSLWMARQTGFEEIAVVGHRIVHGMHHTQPEKATPALLNELRAISLLDPEHLPGEIKLIEVFQKLFPALPQILCFDTAFHQTMPLRAKMLPLPGALREKGLERYGFHGLSYRYLQQELEKLEPRPKARGRVIMAHLGSGASLVALKGGKSVDTSMGFTPNSGVTMGTRTGDLEPGIAFFLLNHEKMTPEAYNALVNHASGLLGMSGKSSDMRILLECAADDHPAAAAIEVFCYQVKKYIGSYSAALGGIDLLVFSGGIGEQAGTIRKKICEGLEFLGINIDDRKNDGNEAVVSNGRTVVRVIKTNEEIMIAQLVAEVMNYSY